MKVIAIVMREGRQCSYNPLDIEQVVIDGKRVDVRAAYLMVTKSKYNPYPPKIRLATIHPESYLEGDISRDGKQYLRSTNSQGIADNLFSLPRWKPIKDNGITYFENLFELLAVKEKEETVENCLTEILIKIAQEKENL